MRKLFLSALLLLSISANAQQFAPEWYILEKGSTVNIIKPGVNDLTYFLASTNNKPIDADAVNAMIGHISYKSGSVVLVHALVNGKYIATDIEGRNILIQGNITKVQRGLGATVGYMKENVKGDKYDLKKESFVWIKEHKEGDVNVTVQCANNQTAIIPFSKVYDINMTTLEMANTSNQKVVE